MLYHSPLFGHIREYLERSKPDDVVFLFVPYIKTVVLEKLLDGISNRIVIVTTWKPNDILLGSSELELYLFCKKHDIALYVSDKLHLKVYSVGLCDAILATGNISHRGLLPGGNHEAAALEILTVEDRLFLERIRKEARLVDDAMYDALKEWVDANKIKDIPEVKLDSIIPKVQKDDFAISALPMTKSVDELVSGYVNISQGKEPSSNLETSACIFHDLANYNVAMGLSESEFLQELAVQFFSHPFICKIDEFIAPEAYFGRIKVWIQNNCTNVPVPSMCELTGNVQVLLEWFVKLGNGRYVIDVPYSRSQRIRRN